MRLYFDSFVGDMNRACNIVPIADVVSAIMPEIVLLPLRTANWELTAVKLLPNTWKQK
jgi:hypothetical protein